MKFAVIVTSDPPTSTVSDEALDRAPNALEQ